MRLRVVAVLATTLLLSVGLPTGAAQAQTPSEPPIELTSSVDANGNVLVEHRCPADAAFGTYPLHVDLLSFVRLALPSEASWTDDRELGTVSWFVCATNYQPRPDEPDSGSYDDVISIGCFNSEGDPATGIVERIVRVDCGGTMHGLFGEEYGSVGFDYPRPRLTPYNTVLIGDRCAEPLAPVIRSAETGDVVAVDAGGVVVDQFGLDPDSQTTSVALVGRCEPSDDLGFTGPPFCATIDLALVDGLAQIENIDGTRCVDLGLEFEVFIDDDVVHVHSPCAADQRLGNEKVYSDVLEFEPWGELGQEQVDRVDPPGRFELRCLSDDDGIAGPSACFAISDYWAEDQRDVGRYACGRYGLGEHLFGGVPIPTLPLHVSVRSGSLDLYGGCWSDTVPTISLADGTVVASVPSIRADEATTVAVPDLSRDPDGVSSLVVVAQCVADGSTGLPSGRPFCIRAWRSPDTLETFSWPFCSDVGVDDAASMRVTLSDARAVSDQLGFVVDADCVDDQVARVVEVDSRGKVLSEIGRTLGDRWNPTTLQTASSIVPERVAAQCVDPASVPAGALHALTTDAPINCFSSAPVTYVADGDSVFSHRACGFVALRLPDTGNPVGPIAMAALCLVALGVTALRTGRRVV